MRSMPLLLLLAVNTIPYVWAKTTFTFPDSNEGTEGDYSSAKSYRAGRDTLIFSFDSDLEKTGVLMFQKYPDAGGNYKRLTENSEDKKITWKVTTDWLKNLGSDGMAVLQLYVYEEGNTSEDARSQYFNITKAATENHCRQNCETTISAAAAARTTTTTTSQKSTSTDGTSTSASDTATTSDEASTTSAEATPVTITRDGETVTMTQPAGESTATLSTTTSSGSTATDTAAASSSGSGTGSTQMNGGKIAGISVGSILGALSLLSGLGFGYRRRRSRRAHAESAMPSTQIHITHGAPGVGPAPPPASVPASVPSPLSENINLADIKSATIPTSFIQEQDYQALQEEYSQSQEFQVPNASYNPNQGFPNSPAGYNQNQSFQSAPVNHIPHHAFQSAPPASSQPSMASWNQTPQYGQSYQPPSQPYTPYRPNQPAQNYGPFPQGMQAQVGQGGNNPTGFPELDSVTGVRGRADLQEAP